MSGNGSQDFVLKCLLTNTRSVVNKFVELQSYVDHHKPYIIAITESWCTDYISDAELQLPNYNLFRCDRKRATGGGVLLYVHASLHAVPCDDLSVMCIEDSVWSKVDLGKGEKLIVGVVYRAPSSDDINNKKLISAISDIENYSDCEHHLIMGDFNVPNVDWNDFSCSNVRSSFALDFINATLDSYLTQHVLQPTRHVPGQNPSILDLVFTSDPNSISQIEHHSPLGSSDHECIFFGIEGFSKQYIKTSNVPKLNYMKGDYLSLNAELNEVDWDTLMCHDSIDVNWNLFKNTVLNASTEYIPKVIKRPTCNKPPWWSPHIGRAIKEKQKFYSHYKFTHSDADFAVYTQRRNQVKSMIRSAKSLYDKSLINNFTSNRKALYGYVRDKRKVKSTISQLEKSDGSLTDSDSEVVEVLNDFFQSVFTIEDSSSVPQFTSRVTCSLREIGVTESGIYDKLSSLNPHKAAGPDCLHPCLLKHCAESLTRPLYLLYTQSLSNGAIPEEWKRANIMPIFKKGSKCKAGNYRPISLTSLLVKILESLIRTEIMTYLMDNSLVSHYQHGFVSKRSCFTNLLESLEAWTLAVDSGYGVDVIYLDYSKAFDSVPHLRLIEKLKSYGISGSLLLWLENFLSGRLQRVVLNGTQSEWTKVTSGVPQGSVLGPLLFVLYINDLPDIISCNLDVFADDTKIYSIITGECDAMALQRNLDKTQEWSIAQLLKLNLDKCKVMHIGNTRQTGYTMETDKISRSRLELSEVGCEKDLGLWTSSSLKSSLQCNKAAASAMRVLGMLKRTFTFNSKELFIFLYKTYVRPLLEYCVQLWCPYLVGDIDTLERVQRRATKLVPELSKLTYESRLRKIDIYSLYYRRRRGDLIETYKLLKGYYNVDWSNFFTLSPVHQTRGHHLKLYKKPARLQLRANFFTQRVVNEWNSLPSDVVLAPTITSFKQKLDMYWKEIGCGYEQRPGA